MAKPRQVLWGGRFKSGPADLMLRFSESVSFDRRLAPFDVAGSKAHAAMLAHAGLITARERDAIHAGLDAILAQIRSGRFAWKKGLEDVHMNIEHALTRRVPAAAKLHTARSRNDQVATDMRLFFKYACAALGVKVLGAQRALLAVAAAHQGVVIPGYTHLQRAQPVYLSHHLLAYFWMLDRDRERLTAAAGAANVLPLGAGALAGVNFDTDRRLLADQLGFDAIAPNSIDAVASRDFALDYLAAAATCATHLSRLGAELVLWSSEEFGFVALPDEWSSGSSIMPQKKNPDAAELLRAKAPRIAAHLVALHGVLHGLPLTYNKDLQEDKEHLFDSCDTIELALAAATGMVAGVKFQRERLSAAAADELIAATDVADLLVELGVPFREAHGIVARLVWTALDGGRQLSGLTTDELAEHSEILAAHEDAYRKVLTQSSWLESKVSEGGTSLARVREQIELARATLDGPADG